MSCNVSLDPVHRDPVRFQSLSGFPMSCNRRGVGRRHGEFSFQSLSGFPMSCNIVDQAPVCDITLRVSIPIGFSNELQLNTRRATLTGHRGFNPYRVFQ